MIKMFMAVAVTMFIASPDSLVLGTAGQPAPNHARHGDHDAFGRF
jgi:hypothetical protein